MTELGSRLNELAQKIAAAGKLPLGSIDELHRRLNTAAAGGSLGRKITAPGDLGRRIATLGKLPFARLDSFGRKLASAGNLPFARLDSFGQKLASAGKLPRLEAPNWNQKFKFEWLDAATDPK